MLNHFIRTLLEMHQNAMKTENMPTKGYLRSNYLLFQADVTKYFMASSAKYFLHVGPVTIFIDLEFMAHHIFWQIIHIDN